MSPPFVLICAKFLMQQVLTRKPDLYLDLDAGELAEMDWGQTIPSGPPTRHLTIPYLMPEAVAIASRFPGPNPPPLPDHQRPRDSRLWVAASIAAQTWLESLRLPLDIYWYERADPDWFGIYDPLDEEEEKVLVHRAGQRKWEYSTRSISSLSMELFRAMETQRTVRLT